MSLLTKWMGISGCAVLAVAGTGCSMFGLGGGRTAGIPLPEHPRPNFQRAEWVNLNGPWAFRFDKADAGVGENWGAGQAEFPLTITVPFSWGSKLSGVGNEADIGWYRRGVKVPSAWKGKRVFLVVGACDWQTVGWFDGKPLGKHEGGYIPFEFDLTDYIAWGKEQPLVLRVEDVKDNKRLYGKQGYGDARGIWQTAYLEARPQTWLDHVHFLPDIDKGLVTVKGALNAPAREDASFSLKFKRGDRAKQPADVKIPAGQGAFEFQVPLANARLWSLEDPYLY